MGEEGDQVGVDLVDGGDGDFGHVVLSDEAGEDVVEGGEEAVCDIESYEDGDEDCDVEAEGEEDEFVYWAITGNKVLQDGGDREVGQIEGGSAVCGVCCGVEEGT